MNRILSSSVDGGKIPPVCSSSSTLNEAVSGTFRCVSQPSSDGLCGSTPPSPSCSRVMTAHPPLLRHIIVAIFSSFSFCSNTFNRGCFDFPSTFFVTTSARHPTPTTTNTFLLSLPLVVLTCFTVLSLTTPHLFSLSLFPPLISSSSFASHSPFPCLLQFATAAAIPATCSGQRQVTGLDVLTPTLSSFTTSSGCHIYGPNNETVLTKDNFVRNGMVATMLFPFEKGPTTPSGDEVTPIQQISFRDTIVENVQLVFYGTQDPESRNEERTYFRVPINIQFERTTFRLMHKQPWAYGVLFSGVLPFGSNITFSNTTTVFVNKIESAQFSFFQFDNCYVAQSTVVTISVQGTINGAMIAGAQPQSHRISIPYSLVGWGDTTFLFDTERVVSVLERFDKSFLDSWSLFLIEGANVTINTFLQPIVASRANFYYAAALMHINTTEVGIAGLLEISNSVLTATFGAYGNYTEGLVAGLYSTSGGSLNINAEMGEYDPASAGSVSYRANWYNNTEYLNYGRSQRSVSTSVPYASFTSGKVRPQMRDGDVIYDSDSSSSSSSSGNSSSSSAQYTETLALFNDNWVTGTSPGMVSIRGCRIIARNATALGAAVFSTKFVYEDLARMSLSLAMGRIDVVNNYIENRVSIPKEGSTPAYFLKIVLIDTISSLDIRHSGRLTMRNNVIDVRADPAVVYPSTVGSGRAWVGGFMAMSSEVYIGDEWATTTYAKLDVFNNTIAYYPEGSGLEGTRVGVLAVHQTMLSIYDHGRAVVDRNALQMYVVVSDTVQAVVTSCLLMVKSGTVSLTTSTSTIVIENNYCKECRFKSATIGLSGAFIEDGSNLNFKKASGLMVRNNSFVNVISEGPASCNSTIAAMAVNDAVFEVEGASGTEGGRAAIVVDRNTIAVDMRCYQLVLTAIVLTMESSLSTGYIFRGRSSLVADGNVLIFKSTSISLLPSVHSALTILSAVVRISVEAQILVKRNTIISSYTGLSPYMPIMVSVVGMVGVLATPSSIVMTGSSSVDVRQNVLSSEAVLRTMPMAVAASGFKAAMTCNVLDSTLGVLAYVPTLAGGDNGVNTRIDFHQNFIVMNTFVLTAAKPLLFNATSLPTITASGAQMYACSNARYTTAAAYFAKSREPTLYTAHYAEVIPKWNGYVKVSPNGCLSRTYTVSMTQSVWVTVSDNRTHEATFSRALVDTQSKADTKTRLVITRTVLGKRTETVSATLRLTVTNEAAITVTGSQLEPPTVTPMATRTVLLSATRTRGETLTVAVPRSPSMGPSFTLAGTLTLVGTVSAGRTVSAAVAPTSTLFPTLSSAASKSRSVVGPRTRTNVLTLSLSSALTLTDVLTTSTSLTETRSGPTQSSSVPSGCPELCFNLSFAGVGGDLGLRYSANSTMVSSSSPPVATTPSVRGWWEAHPELEQYALISSEGGGGGGGDATSAASAVLNKRRPCAAPITSRAAIPLLNAGVSYADWVFLASDVATVGSFSLSSVTTPPPAITAAAAQSGSAVASTTATTSTSTSIIPTPQSIRSNLVKDAMVVLAWGYPSRVVTARVIRAVGSANAATWEAAALYIDGKEDVRSGNAPLFKDTSSSSSASSDADASEAKVSLVDYDVAPTFTQMRVRLRITYRDQDAANTATVVARLGLRYWCAPPMHRRPATANSNININDDDANGEGTVAVGATTAEAVTASAGADGSGPGPDADDGDDSITPGFYEIPVTVILQPPPAPVQVLPPPVQTIVAVGSIGSLLGGSAVAEMQTLALLGMVSCSKGSSRMEDTWAIRALSPAALDSTCKGAIEGNFIVSLGFIALHGLSVVVVFIVLRRRRTRAAAGEGARAAAAAFANPHYDDDATAARKGIVGGRRAHRPRSESRLEVPTLQFQEECGEHTITSPPRNGRGVRASGGFGEEGDGDVDVEMGTLAIMAGSSSSSTFGSGANLSHSTASTTAAVALAAPRDGNGDGSGSEKDAPLLLPSSSLPRTASSVSAAAITTSRAATAAEKAKRAVVSIGSLFSSALMEEVDAEVAPEVRAARMRRYANASEWLQAMDVVQFPSVFLIIFGFLKKGFFVCGVEVLRSAEFSAAGSDIDGDGISDGSGGSTSSFSFGSMGTFVIDTTLLAVGGLSLAFLGVVFIAISLISFVFSTRAFHPKFYYVKNPRIRKLAWFFLPSGGDDQSVPGAKAFSNVVAKFRVPHRWAYLLQWLPFFATFPLVLGIGDSCLPMYALSLSMYAATALIILSLRPYRTRFHNIFLPASMALSALVVGMYAAILESPYDIPQFASDGVSVLANIQIAFSVISAMASFTTFITNFMYSKGCLNPKPIELSCAFEVVGWPFPDEVRGYRVFTWQHAAESRVKTGRSGGGGGGNGSSFAVGADGLPQIPHHNSSAGRKKMKLRRQFRAEDVAAAEYEAFAARMAAKEARRAERRAARGQAARRLRRAADDGAKADDVDYSAEEDDDEYESSTDDDDDCRYEPAVAPFVPFATSEEMAAYAARSEVASKGDSALNTEGAQHHRARRKKSKGPLHDAMAVPQHSMNTAPPAGDDDDEAEEMLLVVEPSPEEEVAEGVGSVADTMAAENANKSRSNTLPAAVKYIPHHYHSDGGDRGELPISYSRGDGDGSGEGGGVHASRPSTGIRLMGVRSNNSNTSTREGIPTAAVAWGGGQQPSSYDSRASVPTASNNNTFTNNNTFAYSIPNTSMVRATNGDITSRNASFAAMAAAMGRGGSFAAQPPSSSLAAVSAKLALPTASRGRGGGGTSMGLSGSGRGGVSGAPKPHWRSLAGAGGSIGGTRNIVGSRAEADDDFFLELEEEDESVAAVGGVTEAPSLPIAAAAPAATPPLPSPPPAPPSAPFSFGGINRVRTAANTTMSSAKTPPPFIVAAVRPPPPASSLPSSSSALPSSSPHAAAVVLLSTNPNNNGGAPLRRGRGGGGLIVPVVAGDDDDDDGDGRLRLPLDENLNMPRLEESIQQKQQQRHQQRGDEEEAQRGRRFTFSSAPTTTTTSPPPTLAAASPRRPWDRPATVVVAPSQDQQRQRRK